MGQLHCVLQRLVGICVSAHRLSLLLLACQFSIASLLVVRDLPGSFGFRFSFQTILLDWVHSVDSLVHFLRSSFLMTLGRSEMLMHLLL